MRQAHTVAALYDIHGNVDALRAVLAEPEVVQADLVVIGGDLVPGPFASEALTLVRDLGDRALVIRGNGERELAAGEGDEARHVAQTVGPEDRAALADAPLWVSIDIAGLGLTCFCHATPRRDDEIITALTPAADVGLAVGDRAERVIVCGHVHVRFDRTVGAVRIVNPGSVGLPYEGTPGAYWALLGPDLQLRRTGYDVAATAERVRAIDYPVAELAGWLTDPPDPGEVTDHFERLRTAAGTT